MHEPTVGSLLSQVPPRAEVSHVSTGLCPLRNMETQPGEGTSTSSHTGPLPHTWLLPEVGLRFHGLSPTWVQARFLKSDFRKKPQIHTLLLKGWLGSRLCHRGPWP